MVEIVYDFAIKRLGRNVSTEATPIRSSKRDTMRHRLSLSRLRLLPHFPHLVQEGFHLPLLFLLLPR